MCLVLLVLVLDSVLFRKKKLFTIQLIFSFLLIFIFGFIFIALIILTHNIAFIGVIIFLILVIFKTVRIISIIETYLKCKKSRIITRITFEHLKKRKIQVITLTLLFIFPFIVFTIGLSPYSLSSIEININDQNGPNNNSQSIQLSFYATLSSYHYLTNETVLRALNGTDFGSGNLKPVEILLLIRESGLKNPVDSQKLAYMIQNCSNSGLNVWIWFVYDLNNGYYPSYEDYNYLPVFKQLFDDWVNNFSLNIHGILFDNEMDQYSASISMDNIFGYLETMLSYRRTVREDWPNAVAMYKSVADQWSNQGYKIALVGMDMTLYDIVDGDADIQQMAGIVNNPPDMWERVSFMLYRNCEYHSTPYTQEYLYTLSNLHKRIYGSRAVVALGCMSYEAYDTIDEIVQDIAILKSQRYSTLELFEFGAFYKTFGYNGLISILNSSLSDWTYPSFRIQFGTIEFITNCLLLFADIFLDLV